MMEVDKVATAKREAIKRLANSDKVDIKQAVTKNSQSEPLKNSIPSERVEISKKAVAKEADSRVRNDNSAENSRENRNTANENIDKALKAVKDEMKKVSSALRGKESDYTVNSNHELILRIRDRATGDQIKQIPSEESVAAKKAFRQVADKLFDQKI